jgi:hypothetical protein
MRRLAFAICLISFAAGSMAKVTALPGASPQVVAAGERYSPIDILVTDESGAPVAGALVRWGIVPAMPFSVPNAAGCIIDLGWTCTTITDRNGIARLQPIEALRPGADAFSVLARRPNDDFFGLGATEISLGVDPDGAIPGAAPAQLEKSGGEDQVAVMGTELGERFRVRLVRQDGTPISDVEVRFATADRGISGTFENALAQAPIVRTDANGFAAAPPFTAGFGIGTGTVVARAIDPATRKFVEAGFTYTVTTPSGDTQANFEDLWWAGPSESGWGFSVFQQDQRLLGVLFTYDQSGQPTWQAYFPDSWAHGIGSQVDGALYAPRGSPYFAYDASRLRVGDGVGSLDLTFEGPGRGALIAYLFAGTTISGAKPTTTGKRIARQDFTSDVPSPLTDIGGLWWGGVSQNGWGLAIHEQPGGLFLVWFTYGADGSPTWFVMPSGSWTDATTFGGPVYVTRAAPWAGRLFDAASVQVIEAGAFNVRFDGRDRGAFTYAIDGRTGTIPIERQPF